MRPKCLFFQEHYCAVLTMSTIDVALTTAAGYLRRKVPLLAKALGENTAMPSQSAILEADWNVTGDNCGGKHLTYNCCLAIAVKTRVSATVDK